MLLASCKETAWTGGELWDRLHKVMAITNAVWHGRTILTGQAVGRHLSGGGRVGTAAKHMKVAGKTV